MAAAHLKNPSVLQQYLAYLTWFMLIVLLIAPSIFVSSEDIVKTPVTTALDTYVERPYCTFFNNRKPEFQPNLKNCTWYQDNCCCRQVEIEVAFGKVKALQSSTPACQKYINYLICYICAPTQYEFYVRQRLMVCREFCDLIFDNCKRAILKGSEIGELYKNGTHFCKSRRFEVTPLSSGGCFYFNDTMDTSSDGVITHPIAVYTLSAAAMIIMMIVNF